MGIIMRTFMSRIVQHGVMAFGLAMILSGCGGGKTESNIQVPRPVKLIVVESMVPERLYSASGRIKAAQRAELSFDRADILAELYVIQGQRVQKGDVLARLDTRNLEIMEKARVATYNEALTTRDRMQRLFDRQAVARADLDRAISAYETAEANLSQVRKDIEMSVLHSPFDGRIASIPAEQHQLIQPRQTILVVHDLSQYEVEVQMPETFILQLGKAAGVSVTARFDQLPGQVFPVKLKNFATEANPELLTYSVIFSLDAPEKTPLLPGMSASLDMTVQLSSNAGLCWIPENALFSDNGERTLVWRVDPVAERVSRTHVQIGARRGGLLEVLDGISPGDTIAISGIHTLRENDAVRAYVPPSRE